MFSQPCTFHPRASCLSVLWNLLTMNVDLPPMNLCKHFYSIGTYNIINLYQLRATSSIRLFFTVKNSTLLISAPSLLFLPSFYSSFFFFSGKDVNVLLKGDLPCFQHFSIQERSLCSIRSICHYEFWSHPCLSSGFPHCYGFNLIIAPAFPHPVQGRLCLD